jgi:hypothetical protein
MAKTRVRLGQLHEKITVYGMTPVVDTNTGAVQMSESVIKQDLPCSVKYIGSPSSGSSEEEQNEQRTGKMKIEFVCRFFDGLNFTDEIDYRGGRFKIYSIHVRGKREWYELRAELQDDESSVPYG